MPLIELPNKEYLRVPSGLTDEEALVLAKRKFPFLYEDRGILDRASSALGRGVSELGETASGIGAGVQSLFGGREGVQRYIEEQKEQRRAEAGKPQALTLQNLIDQYKTQGLLPALGNVPAYVTEQVLQNAPSMAAPLAAGAATTAYSAPLLGPAAPLAGLAAGIGTYGLQTFGSNIQRQAGTEGRTAETMEPGTAAATAAATAPLGFLIDRFTLGLGKIPEKAAANLIAKEIAARGAGKTIAVGAAKGLLEVPTEVLEQAAERWQAGLSLSDKEAKSEYLEAAGGALALGTVGGGGAAYYQRGVAREQVAEQEEAKKATERVQKTAEKAAGKEKERGLAVFEGVPSQTQLGLFQDIEGKFSPLPQKKETEATDSAGLLEEYRKTRAESDRLADIMQAATEKKDWATYEGTRARRETFEKARSALEKKAKQEGVLLDTTPEALDANIRALEKKIEKAADKGESVEALLPQLTALQQQRQQAFMQGTLFDPEVFAARDAAYGAGVEEGYQPEAPAAGEAAPDLFADQTAEMQAEQDSISTKRAFNQERQRKLDEFNLGKVEKDVQKLTEDAPVEAILVGQGRSLNETSRRRNQLEAIQKNIDRGFVDKDTQQLLGLNVPSSAFSLQTAEEAQEVAAKREENRNALIGRKTELEKQIEAAEGSVLQNEEMRALAAVTNRKTSTPEELIHAYRYGVAERNEVLRDEAAAQLMEQKGAVEEARKKEVERATANIKIQKDLQEEIDRINAEYTGYSTDFSVLTYGAFRPHSNTLNLQNKKQADIAATAIRSRIEALESERKTKFPSKTLVDEEGNLTKDGKEYVGVDAAITLLKRLLNKAEQAKPEPMQPQQAKKRSLEHEKARDTALLEFTDAIDTLRKGDFTDQSRKEVIKQANENVRQALDAAIGEINYRRVERQQPELTASEEKKVRADIEKRIQPLIERAQPPALPPLKEKMRDALNTEIAKQEKLVERLRSSGAPQAAVTAASNRLNGLIERRRRLSPAITRGMNAEERGKIRDDIQRVVENNDVAMPSYPQEFGSVAEFEELKRVQKAREESAKEDLGSMAELEAQKRLEAERTKAEEEYYKKEEDKRKLDKKNKAQTHAAALEKSRQQHFDAQKKEVQDEIDRVKEELNYQVSLASSAIHNLRSKSATVQAQTAKQLQEAVAYGVKTGKPLYSAEEEARFKEALAEIEKDIDFQNRLVSDLLASEHLAFLVANDKKVQAALKELGRLEKWMTGVKKEEGLANAKKRAREINAAAKKLAKERADKTVSIVKSIHDQLNAMKAANLSRLVSPEFLSYKEAGEVMSGIRKQVLGFAKQLGLSKGKAFDLSAEVAQTKTSDTINKQRKETIALFRYYEQQSTDLAPVAKQMEAIASAIKELGERLGIDAVNSYKPMSPPTKPDPKGKLNDKRLELISRYDEILQQIRVRKPPKTVSTTGALVEHWEKDPAIKAGDDSATGIAVRTLPRRYAEAIAQIEPVRERLKKPKSELATNAKEALASLNRLNAQMAKEKAKLTKAMFAKDKSAIEENIKGIRQLQKAATEKFNNNSIKRLQELRRDLNIVIASIETQAKKYDIDLSLYASKEKTAAAQAEAVGTGLAAERRGAAKRRTAAELRTGSEDAKQAKEEIKQAREANRQRVREEEREDDYYGTDEEAATAFAIKRGSVFESRGEEPVGEASTKKSVYADLKKAFKTNVENRVTVYQTVAEARKDIPQLIKNINDDTRGFVFLGDAFLIAENIEKGKALSVLLHELGVHIGFNNLFNAKEFAALVNVVKQWAARKDNSIEARVGRAAMDRVKEAKVPAHQMDEELLAYAIEEAVNAGVNPYGVKTSGVIRAWFSRIVKGIKAALTAFKLAPDTLTAQNIVDIAYGAANIELETEIGIEIEQIAKEVFNEPLTGVSTKPSWNAELSRAAKRFIPIGKFGPVKNAYITVKKDFSLKGVDGINYPLFMTIYVVDGDSPSQGRNQNSVVDAFTAQLYDPRKRHSSLELSTTGVPEASTYIRDKYKEYITEISDVDNGNYYLKFTHGIVGNATVAKIWRTLRNEFLASGFVDTGTKLSFFRATGARANTGQADTTYDSKYIAIFSRGEPKLQDVKTDEIFFSRGKAKMPAGFEAVQEFADAAISADKTWLEKVKSQPWAQTALGIKIAKFDRIAAFEELADKMIKAGNGNQAMQMMYDLQGLSDVMSMASASAYDGALVRVKDPNRPGEYRYQASGGASLRSTDKLLKPLLNHGFTPESASNLFTAYMVTLRGKGVGYEKLNFSDDVQKMIKDVLPNIQANKEVLAILDKAREEYNEYNKGQIDFLESSGQISSKIAQEMRSKKDYIPYYRDVQGSLKLFIGDMNPVTLGDLKHQKHLQKLVSGEQKILNYFDSSMQNTMILTDLALTNFAKRNTITALNTLGLLQPIGGTKGPTIRGGNGPENANVIRFKDNGDDKHVVVNTEGTPYEYIPTELLIKGLEGVPFVLPDMVKMLGAPAQWLRKGITLNPLYPYYQLVKDSMAMGATRGVGYSNTMNTLKGIKSYINNEKLIKELQSRGVIQQREMFSGSTEDSTINRRRIVGGESGFQQFLAGQEGRAIKADGAVRAMLYDNYLKQGLSERDAEYMTRKAMPYSRRGLDPSLRYLSHMIPFFNAQIVGLYSLYQSFRGQGPMSEKLQIKKKLFAAGMNMALGTLIYSALVSGEDWYENMPMETRLRNWLIKVPGVKEPVAVPIPFEFGIIFKSFFEATYMGMLKDTPEGAQVLKAFRKQLLGAVPGGTVDVESIPVIGAVPLPLPTAFLPVLESALGKSLYTGIPIEGQKELGVIAEERARDTTSELAKTLGKVAGVSPLHLDHLIRGYTGTVGPAVVALVDATTNAVSGPGIGGAKPEAQISRMPVLSQIFKPVDGGAIIDMAIDTLKESAQVADTYKKMLEEGREAEAEKFLDKNAALIERGKMAGKFRQQLGEFTKYEAAIKRDAGMSATEKRKELDEIRGYKIQLGKEYMQAFRSGG